MQPTKIESRNLWNNGLYHKLWHMKTSAMKDMNEILEGDEDAYYTLIGWWEN